VPELQHGVQTSSRVESDYKLGIFAAAFIVVDVCGCGLLMLWFELLLLML
jgi:hypothetical protein